jgi:hypothetical protein
MEPKLNICVMGNSHIAALKLGYEMIAADYPHAPLTFFGDRGAGMRFLRAEGTKLVPTNEKLRTALRHTSGGKDCIDTTAYDIIVVVGLELEPFFDDATQGYSRKLLVQTLKDNANDPGYTFFGMFSRMRAVYKKPIYMAHAPLRAQSNEPMGEGPERYLAAVALFNEIFLKPQDMTLLPQPPETVVSGNRTAHHYSVGSMRLSVGSLTDAELHASDDHYHMNAEFGAVWLRGFFAHIGVMPVSAMTAG